MQTRTMLLALLLAGVPVAAEEPTSEPPVTEPAKAASESDSKPADAEPSTPARPTSQNEAAASPQRFEPSEQVRADFDVSFPVDI